MPNHSAGLQAVKNFVFYGYVAESERKNCRQLRKNAHGGGEKQR
jgi:hypothetical protein